MDPNKNASHIYITSKYYFKPKPKNHSSRPLSKPNNLPVILFINIIFTMRMQK